MKKNTVGTRLREFAEKTYVSYTELAEKLETRPQHLNNFFTGVTMPGGELMAKLSQLGLNINWLMTGEGPMMIHESRQPRQNIRSIPLVSEVQCGIPASQWIYQSGKTIEAEGIRNLLNPFAVSAQGMSMAQTILPGDILICYEPQEEIKDGTITAVSFWTEPESSQGVIKRVKHLEDGKILLYSDNARNFPPVLYKQSEIYKLYPVFSRIIRTLK